MWILIFLNYLKYNIFCIIFFVTPLITSLKYLQKKISKTFSTIGNIDNFEKTVLNIKKILSFTFPFQIKCLIHVVGYKHLAQIYTHLPPPRSPVRSYLRPSTCICIQLCIPACRVVFGWIFNIFNFIDNSKVGPFISKIFNSAISSEIRNYTILILFFLLTWRIPLRSVKKNQW